MTIKWKAGPPEVPKKPGRKILVLAPHPDDEALGCGGSLRKHVLEGDLVQVIFLTSGDRGCKGKTEQEAIHIREKESRKAAAVLGYGLLEFWREPDGRFKAKRSLVDRLVRKLKEFRPDLIYVTHEREMHPDHRSAARLVRQAMQKISWSIAPLVYMYEIWTPLESMNHIVDISPYLEAKMAAIRAHQSQCKEFDFEAAFSGLNRYRGGMHSWPGGDYAEIFKIMKIS